MCYSVIVGIKIVFVLYPLLHTTLYQELVDSSNLKVCDMLSRVQWLDNRIQSNTALLSGTRITVLTFVAYLIKK